MTNWMELNWAPTSNKGLRSQALYPSGFHFPIFKKGIIGSLVLKREEKEEEGQRKNLRRRVVMRINRNHVQTPGT